MKSEGRARPRSAVAVVAVAAAVTSIAPAALDAAGPPDTSNAPTDPGASGAVGAPSTTTTTSTTSSTTSTSTTTVPTADPAPSTTVAATASSTSSTGVPTSTAAPSTSPPTSVAASTPSTTDPPATTTSTTTTPTNTTTTTTTTTTVPEDPLALLDESPKPEAEFLASELQRWQQSANREPIPAAMPGAGDLRPGRVPLVSRLEDESWIEAVLAATRIMRSGGAYDLSAGEPGGAAGAYGYSDDAWNRHDGYPTAGDAPPDVQDDRARADTLTILLAFAGDVSSVPRYWEAVAVDGDTEWLELPAVESEPEVEVEVETEVEAALPPVPAADESGVEDWLRSYRSIWDAVRNGDATVDDAESLVSFDRPADEGQPVVVTVTSLPHPDLSTTTTTATTTTTTTTTTVVPAPAASDDVPDDPGLLSDATVDAAWRALPPAPVPHGPDHLRAITFPVLGPASYYDGWGDPRDDGLRRHQGTDIIGVRMQPLLAAVDGVLTRVDPETPGISGGAVSIRDAEGWRYNYFHLNNDTPGTDDGLASPEFRTAVGLEPGDSVVAGQIIGYMGDSGNAEGSVAHLHFEIRDPDGAARPSYWSLRNAEARQACSIGIGPWSIVDPPGTTQPAMDPSDSEVVHTQVDPLFGDGWWSIDADGRVVAVGDAALIMPSRFLACDAGPSDLYGSDAGGWNVPSPPPTDGATDPANPVSADEAPETDPEDAVDALDGTAVDPITTGEAAQLARAQVPPEGLDAAADTPVPDEQSQVDPAPVEDGTAGPQLVFTEPSSGEQIIVSLP